MSRQPTHPGAVLREDVLPNLKGMNISNFSKALHLSRQTIHGILNETKPVTPNVALRLGKFLGNGPDIWLRMQKAYDLWETKQEIADELKDIKKFKAA